MARELTAKERSIIAKTQQVAREIRSLARMEADDPTIVAASRNATRMIAYNTLLLTLTGGPAAIIPPGEPGEAVVTATPFFPL